MRATSELAAFNHEIIGIGRFAVDRGERGCIVLVEEVFLPKIDDFLIDPIEQTFIAFLDGRSDGVKITQGRNADLEALMYQGPGEDFSVVGGEGVAAAVKQGIVGVGVLVVLLQLYLRMILFKVGLCGRAFSDDKASCRRAASRR